jgi:hypothetical protein
VIADVIRSSSADVILFRSSGAFSRPTGLVCGSYRSWGCPKQVFGSSELIIVDFVRG